MTTETPRQKPPAVRGALRFFRPFERRTVYFPTFSGWCLIATLFLAPLIYWFFCGEALLSLTERKHADILVVEGWMHEDALFAAAQEFKSGGYRFVLATGEYTAEAGSPHRWSWAEIGAKTLRRAGVPADKIVRVSAEYATSRRTFATAATVRQHLNDALHLEKASLNVFTIGAHARRSRLVYEKALGHGYDVGVVSWSPASTAAMPWWQSSERAKELLIETTGWFYELLFNSGRST